MRCITARNISHTLSAGLLAVDPGGMVLAANTQARFLLQGLPVMRGRRVEELFRCRFEDLLQRQPKQRTAAA